MLTVVLLTPEIMEDRPIDHIENYILKPFSKESHLVNILEFDSSVIHS